MGMCWSSLPLKAALLRQRMTSLLCPLTPAQPEQLSRFSLRELLFRCDASAPQLFPVHPTNVQVPAEPLCPPSLSWAWCPSLVERWVGAAPWAEKVLFTARAVTWLLLLPGLPPIEGRPPCHSMALTLSPSPPSQPLSCTSPSSSPLPVAPWWSTSWGSRGPVEGAAGCSSGRAFLPFALPLSR